MPSTPSTTVYITPGRYEWSGCQFYCQGMGGNFTCINDQSENNVVLDLLDSQLDESTCAPCSKTLRAAWIGFNSGWAIAQCSSTFENWNRIAHGGDADEPNGAVGDPAAIYASGNIGKVPGSWNDNMATTLLQCVCSVPQSVPTSIIITTTTSSTTIETTTYATTFATTIETTTYATTTSATTIKTTTDTLAAAPSPMSTTFATTSAAALFVEVVEGRLRLEVAGAVEFVNEPHVKTMFRFAIVDWFRVNDTWVHDVEVSLRDGRRLARPRAGNNRLLLSSQKTPQEVDVSWSIEIPPGGDGVIVNVLVDSYNQKSVSEITSTLNALIAGGMLGDPYELNVTWNYAWVPEPETVGHDQQPSDDDIGLLVIVVSICIMLLVVLVLVVVLVILARRRHTHTSPTSHMRQKKRRKNDFAEIAGPLCNACFEDLLSPPPSISQGKGEQIEQLLRAISDCQDGEPAVFITYALGSRPLDAEGYGPGLFYVAAMAKFLFDNAVPCFCDVMLGEYADYTSRRRVFNAQIARGRLSSCELVVVIQTDTLYTCLDTLRDIYAAQEHNIKIFPLRFDHPIPNEKNPWPQVKRDQMEYMLMAAAVETGFCKLNSIPSPPYTIRNQPSVLKDMLQDLKEVIGSDRNQASKKEPHFQLVKESARTSTKLVDPKPSTLGSNASADVVVPESTPLKDSSDICLAFDPQPVHVLAMSGNQSQSAINTVRPSWEKKDKGSSHSRHDKLAAPKSQAEKSDGAKLASSSSLSKDRRRLRSIELVPDDRNKLSSSLSRRGRDSQPEPSPIKRGRDIQKMAPPECGKSSSSSGRRDRAKKNGVRRGDALVEEDRQRRQDAAIRIQRVSRAHLARVAEDRRKNRPLD